MKTVITRIGFCLECYKNNRPQIDDPFLVCGSTGYHVRYSGRNGRYTGFVPTLYRLEKVIGENVIVSSNCCMHECGVDRYITAEGYFNYFAIHSKWKKHIFTLPQWNGLVLWKHDWDYYI